MPRLDSAGAAGRPPEILALIERMLFVIGLVLAVWCVLVVAQTRFFASLPVPSPRTSLARLPGEEDTQPAVNASRTRTDGLRPGEWVAKLDAPSVKLSATVLEGSDDGTLARAAGHIEDTALPGDSGNVGIAAHRDTIFRPIRNLRIGDPLTVSTADRVFEYRITSTLIVRPEDVYVLDPTERPTLTLVTCYPFTFIGHAPKRFIVKAQLVSARAR
jgi:sortase A